MIAMGEYFLSLKQVVIIEFHEMTGILRIIGICSVNLKWYMLGNIHLSL